MSPLNKPPLGIRPQWLLDEQRFEEILSGISRFDNGNAIPIEWLIELREIFYRSQKRRDKNPNVSENLIIRNHTTGND